MLALADRPIEEVIRYFAHLGVQIGLLVPTETGLGKSILDAHAQLRGYLAAAGVHDYSEQPQGGDSKILLSAWLVGLDSKQPSTASLYRPPTKSGDPRIWFKGLPAYARPGNVLAIIASGGELYVINTSISGLLESGSAPNSPLGGLLHALAEKSDEPVLDLLSKLREISALGFVESQRPGPTGVGMTLESMLGISANSSPAPDYRGIEIKATRVMRGLTRASLFSKVPDWRRSAMSSAVELLQNYGYDRGGRRQLYCSMNNKANSLGLFLATRGDDLHALHAAPAGADRVVQWSMDGLRKSLVEKHQQTFWVKAVVRKDSNGREYFHYVRAVHTKAPMVANLESLFELGHIEVDFLLHLLARQPHEEPRARDHGYLFKMSPQNIDMLFPPNETYDLGKST